MSMIGRTLGNFTLEAEIGKGGMGINAGSKVKRRANEKCNTLIHFPICSKTATCFTFRPPRT